MDAESAALRALLSIWRHATGEADPARGLDLVTAAAAPHLATDSITVRRLDVDRGSVETVAFGRARPSAPVVRGRTECSPDQFQDLLAWCRTSGRLVRHDGSAAFASIIGDGLAGRDIVVGSLGNEHTHGAAIFAARTGHKFGDGELRFARALLEPLSVGLITAERLRDLNRLQSALEADRQALLQRLERDDVSDVIVGAESGLREIMERVERVAGTDTPVLLLGETGTGKEVVARALHARSRRAGGPIVRVNCGAIPPSLIDSELFGHERGSFTGAVSTRKGWFERADGGTLFLDEIGELTADAQVRLLRILQDGTFERVGAHRTRTVDVRLVAATNRNLHEMVVRGQFREDLWYRINVFPIRLPPLRERREDIPALASHFAWRAGKRLGGHPLTLSPDDIDLLVEYHWPGNVRELAAVIERAAILGDGKRLRIAEALGRSYGHSELRVGSSSSGMASQMPDDSESGDLSLDQAMAQHIERVLRATRGRIEGKHGAAARLRINPHTLRARMRKLGIDWSRFRGPDIRVPEDDPHW
jgi:transcriptional regulator with GAF, ATPase, and Fis domain